MTASHPNRSIRPLVLAVVMTLTSACGSAVEHSRLKDSSEEHHFCFQTFNAYGPAYSPAIEPRTREWGREMALAPCSIVQSQEIWTESHYELAKQHLGKSLPRLSSVRFDDAERPYTGKSGLALFTDEIIEERSFEEFTVNQDGVIDAVRGALGVIKGMGKSRIELRQAESYLNLINLHTHPQSEVIRTAQMTQLARAFSEMLPLTAPIVISGDFNFTPDSGEYAFLRDVLLLEDSFAATHGGYTRHTCSYCSDNPHHWGGGDRVIDFIFTRGSLTQILRAERSIFNLFGHNGVIPSDHYGLKTEFSVSRSNLKPVSDERFAKRKSAAIKAIDHSLAILKAHEHDRSDLYSAIEFLEQLLLNVISENTRSPLVQNLRNP